MSWAPGSICIFMHVIFLMGKFLRMTDTILQVGGNFHNLQHCEILWILFISTRKFHIVIIIVMILDPSTGTIGLNPSKFLDRESIPDYHLIIEAIDNGATRRTGNATVVIVLQVTINMCSCRHTQFSSSMTPCLYLPCFLFPYCLLPPSLSLPFFSLSLSLPLFSPSLSLRMLMIMIQHFLKQLTWSTSLRTPPPAASSPW